MEATLSTADIECTADSTPATLSLAAQLSSLRTAAARLSAGQTALGSVLGLAGSKAPFLAPATIAAVTIASCLLYIDPSLSIAPDELLLYSAVGLVGGLSFLLLLVFGANARQANTAAFFQLDDRLTDLRVQLSPFDDSAGSGQADSAAIGRATDHAVRLSQRLSSSGSEWASGQGYICAWRLLHQAEQALIEIQPRHQVVAGAVNDALRLSGSEIEHTDQLISRLSEAMKVMSPPGVEVYYEHSAAPPSARQRASNARASMPVAGNEPPAEDDFDAEDASCSERVARSVLRNVHGCINDYRDNARAGLLKSRNMLLATLALTALGTYALLATIIVQQVQRQVVVAAAVYFGIGAIVGLFNRLRTASRYSIRDNPLDVEDYGLSSARVMSAPVFSGLAAVIGVFVLSQFQLSISGSAVPTGPSPQLTSMPGIADVFNLRTNSMGLLLSAILGTTPELLAGYLHRPAADLKRSLKSSEPSGALPRPAFRNGS